MNNILYILVFCIILFPNYSLAQQPVVLQFKYSPLGGIDADDDEYSNTEYDYAKYEMRFERSMSIRAIATPIYISAQRSVTNIGNATPDTQVETLAIGFAGIIYDPYELEIGTYLIGALGIGTGRFEYKDPALNDWEAMIEGNVEVGFTLSKHLLVGSGIDYQHFGEPGDTKAHSWTLYVSTGFIF